MSGVYFVMTDYYAQGGYYPYRDWFRLAELSGYPIIHLSQLDPDSDNVYIISPFNGEYAQGWQNPKARIILYQLEWNVDGTFTPPPGVEVWMGDKWAAQQAGARYVPIGSHPGLNQIAGEFADKHYDISFMGYRDPHRRAHMLNEWAQAGLTIAPDAWGIERSRYLLDSKCMGIIHQHDNTPVIAPLRMCIAAAHKCPVITEEVNDAGMFSLFVWQSRYKDLTSAMRHFVADPNKLADDGQTLYRQLCEDYTFRDSIEAAL